MAFLDQNSENALHISKRMEGARVVETCMLSLLVVLSGFLTGLTLAYFSVDYTRLRVVAMCGKPREQIHACRVLLLRKDSYHLLTTLSLLNIIAIGSIPVVAQGVIQNNLQSALISTAALLVFATIIPQSVCLPYALPVAGWLGPAVQFLIWITFPLTWPIARLLEWTFGNQIPPRFRRYELRELVRQHRTDVDGDLDIFTAEMTWNALTLSLHTARHVMVPIHKAFMIPLGRQLDYKTFCEIQEAGWSRIILYTEGEDGRTILGYILSKNLILENPQTRTPMDKQILYELPLVAAQEPLTNVLKVLLERQRHMALVYHPKSTFSDDESSVIATTWKERFQSKIAARVCRGEVDTEDSEKAINSEQRSMASVNTRFDDSTTRRSGKATLHPRIQVEPIGIITLEDIMEKLIGELIRDETDSASPRYPRTFLSNHLSRAASLPSRPNYYGASTEHVARARPSSIHYPILETVEESNSNPTSSYGADGRIAHRLEKTTRTVTEATPSQAQFRPKARTGTQHAGHSTPTDRRA